MIRNHAAPSLRWFAVIAAAGAIVWSTSLVIDAWSASHAPRPEPRSVDAVGTATRHVQPDRLSWSATLSAHGRDRATAGRELATGIAATRELLARLEIRDAELSFAPASYDEETQTVTHRNADGSEDERQQPSGFSATQKIEVHASDLPRALRALRELTATPGLQIALDAEEPACTYSGLDALQEELLEAAQGRVRARADAALAAIAHARVGALVSTDLGTVATGALGSPSLDACVHGTDVIATVKATYLVK